LQPLAIGKLPLSGWVVLATSFGSTKNASPEQEGGYTASRATIFLGNVVRAPHARARNLTPEHGGLLLGWVLKLLLIGLLIESQGVTARSERFGAARSFGASMLSTLPNDLLLLHFSLVGAQTACRLSQASRSWQLWLVQNHPGYRLAWLHHRALLSWAERVRLRVMQRLRRRSWIMSSFQRVERAAAHSQMFSSSEIERLFSQATLTRRVHMRCCSCGAIVSMSGHGAAQLQNHLLTKHRLDDSAVVHSDGFDIDPADHGHWRWQTRSRVRLCARAY